MSIVRKIGVVICGKDPTGAWRVLLRKNSPFNGTSEEWNVIYGHIKPAENGDECALREIQEETGLITDQVHATGQTVSRLFPDGQEITIEYFWTAFMGLPTKLQLNEESIGYQWSLPKEVEVLITDAQQRESVLCCLKRAAI